ncbi:AtpZ/AtpI family protein [bacterium]|nr:AtpZ/AtpI family protein [bacterium]MBU1637471.1 AtpZ/AtpI family protein [bacterium]MBU1919730.1 AtpZ/AtpI family protein [bacterium]
MPEKERVNRYYRRDPLQIGGTIVGVTVVFGAVGWWIDSMIGSFPFGLMIGSVIGLFGVLYSNYLWLKASDKEDSEAARKSPNKTP